LVRSIILYFSLVTLLIFRLPLGAQTATVTPSTSASVTLRPIDARFSTLEGLTYTQGGNEIESYQDFHQIFDPLKDFETERLINHSESSLVSSKLVESAGLIGVVVGVVGLFTNSSNQTPWWITAAGGAVVFDIGTFFGSDAQTSKFNAVQRYNRFAYGREAILPQTPADEKSLLPAVTPSATATPEMKK
jgi:hypothetical protein